MILAFEENEENILNRILSCISKEADVLKHEVIHKEEAIKELTERKRNVILLSYFMEMSDADIAREMNLVRSTIHEHRTRSLEILRKIMEGIADEKDV